MTHTDKAGLADRIKRGVASAASRGLVVWGYRVDGDRLDLWTRPAERRRRAPPVVDRPTGTRRGVAASAPAPQGSLL